MHNKEFNKSEKLFFQITRTKLETKEILDYVQRCFDLAQSTLVSKTVTFALKKFISQNFNLAISLVIVLFASFLIRFYYQLTATNSFILSAILCPSLLFIIVALRSYFGWRSFISDTITNLDISARHGKHVYSKENNGLFVAVPSNSDQKCVIAMAIILIDDEKNVYREISLPMLDSHTGLITRVSVLPEYQGKGAGRAVVQACIDFAIEKHLKCIKLVTTSSQEAAVSLYKSLGFKITKTIETVPSFGFNKIIMELNLATK